MLKDSPVMRLKIFDEQATRFHLAARFILIPLVSVGACQTQIDPRLRNNEIPMYGGGVVSWEAK
jgi:hypothetical protein